VTERADPAHLAPGPRLRYPLKAVHTRLRSLAWRARGGQAPGGPGFRILFYHRVSDGPRGPAVSPRRFCEQLDAIAAEGYRGVDVLTALDAAPGAVGLAFDGGYLDLPEHVLPELERHGFSATVFLATGRVAVRGGGHEFLSWDDVSRLDGGPLRFEAGTATYPNLLAVDDARAHEEIAGSKRELEERLGREVSVFCYPRGLFGEREVRLVAAAGYRAACTEDPGLNSGSTSPFRLHRIRVEPRDSLLDFRAKLDGGFDAPSRLRR